MAHEHRLRIRTPTPFDLDVVLRGHGWVALGPHRYERELGSLLTSLDLSSLPGQGARAPVVALEARQRRPPRSDRGQGVPERGRVRGPARGVLARRGPGRLPSAALPGARRELRQRHAHGRAVLEPEHRRAPHALARAAGLRPYAVGQALRLLGRFDDLALDSWVRKRAAELHELAPGDDRAIARRYAEFDDYAGLALWMDVTAQWHLGAEAIP